MLHCALLATAVALAGLTSATVTAPTCDATCQTGAVGLLLGRCASKRLPPACVDGLAAEASAFCSGFLAPVTISQTALATTTQVQSVTVTEAATTTATETTTSTTTTVTTITDVTTEASTVVSTSTTTTFAITVISSMVPERRDARPTSCPKLSTPRLQRLAPAKVSSICSLLGVTPSATTVTGTATATATSTTTASTETTTSATTATVVDVATALSQTTTSTTTTTTTTTVATATQIIDVCHSSRSFQGSNGVPATHVLTNIGIVPSAEECCRHCWTEHSCVVSVYQPETKVCLFVIIAFPLPGASPTDLQCPRGKLPWVRTGTGPGIFLDGPCGIP